MADSGQRLKKYKDKMFIHSPDYLYSFNREIKHGLRAVFHVFKTTYQFEMVHTTKDTSYIVVFTKNDTKELINFMLSSDSII